MIRTQAFVLYDLHVPTFRKVVHRYCDTLGIAAGHTNVRVQQSLVSAVRKNESEHTLFYFFEREKRKQKSIRAKSQFFKLQLFFIFVLCRDRNLICERAPKFLRTQFFLALEFWHATKSHRVNCVVSRPNIQQF